MSETDNSQYFLRVQKAVGRAINRYGMISAGERVAVGVSGGKDSIVLLETLALRRRRIPIHYDLLALHVNVKNITPVLDRTFYESLCRRLDPGRDPKKTVCFVCAWHRRKQLFRMTGELSCTRLALGHHMDDAIETLFLNMAFNGSLSSIPPRLSMFEGEFDIIRPLILLTEREIDRYARLSRFPALQTQCPYGQTTRRADMKRIVSELVRMNRKARKNIFAAMSNIHREHLPPGID
jgi:tRNA 2-thiocytidine biosynthesis protein TtcA